MLKKEVQLLIAVFWRTLGRVSGEFCSSIMNFPSTNTRCHAQKLGTPILINIYFIHISRLTNIWKELIMQSIDISTGKKTLGLQPSWWKNPEFSIWMKHLLLSAITRVEFFSYTSQGRQIHFSPSTQCEFLGAWKCGDPKLQQRIQGASKYFFIKK